MYQRKRRSTRKGYRSTRRGMKSRYNRKKTRMSRRVNYNPTIRWVVPTAEQFREYKTVVGTQVNNLTPLYNNGTSTGTLTDYFSGNNTLIEMFSRYQWVRCSAIRVRLIPEKWVASTLLSTVAAPELSDGEKPKLHFIHDDGSVAAGNSATTLTVAQAKSYGNRVYKQREFTKNMIFNIKPYKRNVLDNNLPAFTSANQWCPTSSLTTWLDEFVPQRNLWMGYTDVPTNFKFRTEVDLVLNFKDPYYPAAV